jgi:hypothetical protein
MHGRVVFFGHFGEHPVEAEGLRVERPHALHVSYADADVIDAQNAGDHSSPSR